MPRLRENFIGSACQTANILQDDVFQVHLAFRQKMGLLPHFAYHVEITHPEIQGLPAPFTRFWVLDVFVLCRSKRDITKSRVDSRVACGVPQPDAPTQTDTSVHHPGAPEWTQTASSALVVDDLHGPLHRRRGFVARQNGPGDGVEPLRSVKRGMLDDANAQ